MMFRSITLAICLLARIAASTSVVASQLRQKHAGASFISSLKFKLKLRICNAYPYTYPMDVYLGKEKLTEMALAYKACGDFTPALKAGDKLDFKVGESSAGSFSISEIPENDAVMLLVIYRHDTLSTAVSFESHVFSNLANAQIAVLDAYRGKEKAIPRIQDVRKHQPEGVQQRSEELRYNSVVAVNQGMYEVVLEGATDGQKKATHQLVALNRESYLVVRCGVQTEQGQAFPQELMVYPKSDPRELGGAAMYSLFVAALLTLFSTFGA